MCQKKERCYGFTYKKNTSNPLLVNEEDYEPILIMLRRKGIVIDVQYESDSKGLLHIHGLVEFSGKTPLFKSMCPKGYHSHFEEIYDIEGWSRYIHKDDFRKQYMF